MARKANIIKSLKMMGYTVGEDSGIFSIALLTGSGHIVATFSSEKDLESKDFIIEEIVGKINGLIVKDFRGDKI